MNVYFALGLTLFFFLMSFLRMSIHLPEKEPLLNCLFDKIQTRIDRKWKRKARLMEMRQKNSIGTQHVLNVISKLLRHRDENIGGSRLMAWMLMGGILGWLLGTSVDNMIISILLSFVGMGTPFFYMHNDLRRYERDRNEKLLVVLANIQGEYMKPHVPFVHAVTAVLPAIPEPLYRSFKRYADTINLFHPDSPLDALRVLEKEVDNYFFTEYICLAMLAEEGEHGLKATMCSIPDEYESYLETNRAFADKVVQYNQNFQMTFLTLPLMIGFLKVVSVEYFNILTHHFIGQMTLIGLTVLYLATAVVFNRLNTDVKLEL